MTSADRVLAILQLFTIEKPIWTAEEASSYIGVSVSSTYRYFKSLTKAGYLSPITASGFSLGPAFIEFDRLIRKSDPMLQAARSVMSELIKHAPDHATVLLARLYHDRVMCVHQVVGTGAQAPVGYERGLPMPMFKGATSKIILAHLKPKQIRKIYEANRGELKQTTLGSTLEQFQTSLAAIRRAGYCVAQREIDPDRIGIAAPVFGLNSRVIGSLSIAVVVDAIDEKTLRKLIALISASAHEIEYSMYGTGKPANRKVSRRNGPEVQLLAQPPIRAPR